jgi:hypothetical protein
MINSGVQPDVFARALHEKGCCSVAVSKVALVGPLLNARHQIDVKAMRM